MLDYILMYLQWNFSALSVFANQTADSSVYL